MTRAEAPKRGKATTTGGRGKYTSRACNVCRVKKTKCDGAKPVCGTCSGNGRQEECSWGKESVRKPRTEAHFEAMRKRAEALREYANLLESMLEKCRREHGGLSDDGHSYLQFRPQDADGMILPDDIDVDHEYEYDDVSSDSGAITLELCVPTQKLKLGEGGLLLHGNTAIFRFAPELVLQPSVSRFPTIAENTDACYVLLVDGVDERFVNPLFEWHRYLPAAVPMERREHDKLLDLLFKFLTSWCLRIVPALFLRDMCRALSIPRSAPLPITPHYSPMLHNSLIALATGFSDDPRIRDPKSRQCFAAAAKSYIETECHKPNISVVHALSILSTYHSSQGDQTLGYMYFVGLSIDCSAWVQSGLISEHDQLDRNWAHWTTCSQDVCWSLYVGRDFSVRPPSDSSRIPIPFVDSDFDQMLWCYPPANIPPQPNFLSKTFASTCELLMIARRIMDVVNDLNSMGARNEINDELISNIDLQLNTWKGRLSPEVDLTHKTRATATPHRLTLHLAYWWLFILLHRPFYHRKTRVIHGADKDIDHVKLCKRAAENIMELVATYKSLYPIRYCSISMVQIIFSAGTVFLLMAVQAISGLRVAQGSLKHSLTQANLCLEDLLEIGKSWQCSTNIAGILRGLFQGQLKPLLERRSAKNAGAAAGSSPTSSLPDRRASSSPVSTVAPSRLSRSTSRPPIKTEDKRPTRRPSWHGSTALISNGLDSSSISNNGRTVSISPSMSSLPLAPFIDGEGPVTVPLGPPPPPPSQPGWLFSASDTTPPRYPPPPMPPPPTGISAYGNENVPFHPQPQPQPHHPPHAQVPPPVVLPMTTTRPNTAFDTPRLLAMLGGESLSDAPFMPHFTLPEPLEMQWGEAQSYMHPSPSDTDTEMVEPFLTSPTDEIVIGDGIVVGANREGGGVTTRSGENPTMTYARLGDSEFEVLEQFWAQHLR